MRAKISPPLTILAASVCGMFNSGCFVVTSNHVSKPVGPPQTVEFRHQDYDTPQGWYVRHFHSSDLDFDIGVCNNIQRMEMPFWFWILPLPNSSHGSNQSFEVKADFQPATGRPVLIDPRRIEYIPTNGTSVGPSKISRRDGSAWKAISPGPVSITNLASFSLEYKTPCDPDMPFQLSIDGIFVSDQTNLETIISYKRAKIIRAGFRLPY